MTNSALIPRIVLAQDGKKMTEMCIRAPPAGGNPRPARNRGVSAINPRSGLRPTSDSAARGLSSPRFDSIAAHTRSSAAPIDRGRSFSVPPAGTGNPVRIAAQARQYRAADRGVALSYRALRGVDRLRRRALRATGKHDRAEACGKAATHGRAAANRSPQLHIKRLRHCLGWPPRVARVVLSRAARAPAPPTKRRDHGSKE